MQKFNQKYLLKSGAKVVQFVKTGFAPILGTGAKKRCSMKALPVLGYKGKLHQSCTAPLHWCNWCNGAYVDCTIAPDSICIENFKANQGPKPFIEDTKKKGARWLK